MSPYCFFLPELTLLSSGCTHKLQRNQWASTSGMDQNPRTNNISQKLHPIPMCGDMPCAKS